MTERAATEPREREAVARGDGGFPWRWWRIGGSGTCWRISRFFGASVGFWDEAKRRGRAKRRERLVLKQSRSIVSFSLLDFLGEDFLGVVHDGIFSEKLRTVIDGN